jgi:hypothetical protein
MTLFEQVARGICASYGSRFVGPGQSIATRELGWKPDAGHLDEYVDKHWREWKNEAAFALAALKHLPDDPGPRYTAGEYSRSNIDALVEDALS